MRSLALFLLFVPVYAPASAAASFTQPKFTRPAPPLRLTLVNMSGRRRQIHLSSGTVELPLGQPVVIEAKIGDHLAVLSDTDSSIKQQITVALGDDARMISVM